MAAGGNTQRFPATHPLEKNRLNRNKSKCVACAHKDALRPPIIPLIGENHRCRKCAGTSIFIICGNEFSTGRTRRRGRMRCSVNAQHGRGCNKLRSVAGSPAPSCSRAGRSRTLICTQ